MAELAYSVAEAAKALGISRDSAYKLIKAGQLPNIRWNGRIVIPKKALDDHLAAAAARSVAS
jgi:excisionase family DNA binding protein